MKEITFGEAKLGEKKPADEKGAVAKTDDKGNVGTAKKSEPKVAENAKPTPPKPFAVVVLDPGHGGQDSGAMCGGVMEKDLTLDVARRIDRLLDAEGIATLMTRLGDTYISLPDRAAFGNRARDSIFVSIHFNEDNKPVASGVETYYAAHQIASVSAFTGWLPFLSLPPFDSPKRDSQSLAGFIQEALVVRTRAVDRGTQAKQFFVIANVTSPAVLIEGGFLTNKEDVSKLASEDYFTLSRCGLSAQSSISGYRSRHH